MIVEAQLRWEGLGSPKKFSTFHFTSASSDAAIAQWLGAFRAGLASAIHNSMHIYIEDEVRYLDEETGELQGYGSLGVPSVAVPGTVSGEQAADATQFLVQWGTSVVVGGRRLRGRSYLPGVPAASISQGNVHVAAIGDIEGAAEDAMGTEADLVVWSRKNGIVAPVTRVTCWNEFAVQRRRRG